MELGQGEEGVRFLKPTYRNFATCHVQGMMQGSLRDPNSRPHSQGVSLPFTYTNAFYLLSSGQLA